ncbi:MAG: SIMPL domain-containing protein [Bacteroidaceae bacterium]|nr:SIMPL domain-containing protein [Bacteroidaceae bacterium]
MEKKQFVRESAIIAAGILLGLFTLGVSLKSAIDRFTDKDRRVTVKGLAEKEVDADKVTWPIQTKEIGNDLPALYSKINSTTAAIKRFLTSNGIKESEISVNAPTVIDLNAERYGENNRSYRYNITSTIIVTSQNVKLVRSLINRQGELLPQGIAIVDGGYENPIKYEFVAFRDMKPEMMTEAIKNAEKTAQQFAENSNSKLDKIVNADQGQFSIDNRDENTPYIKKVRVVTTITYSLKD